MSNIIAAEPYVRPAATVVPGGAKVLVAPVRPSELSFVERIDQVRPYVAATLWLVVAALVVGLVRRLYMRYRDENVPLAVPQAFDRSSLRRRKL